MVQLQAERKAGLAFPRTGDGRRGWREPLSLKGCTAAWRCLRIRRVSGGNGGRSWGRRFLQRRLHGHPAIGARTARRRARTSMASCGWWGWRA